MCEIVGGALSGGFTTHEDTLVTTNAIINCMTSVIVDPNAFDAPNAQAEADAFVEWVKASPLAANTERIMVPGEPEQARRAGLQAEVRALAAPPGAHSCPAPLPAAQPPPPSMRFL